MTIFFVYGELSKRGQGGEKGMGGGKSFKSKKKETGLGRK